MREQQSNETLAPGIGQRFFGKYRGKVTSNEDPTGRGLLELLVPAVMGDQPVWALPCVPYAGENMGLYAIPERDTGVWVEFEAGDPSYPIWVGCFWGDDQAPKDVSGSEPTPPVKTIRTKQGLLLTLDDQQEVITLTDEQGNNFVKIDARQRQVTVQGSLKAVVEAPQIELVENATHPVVFGDNLLQYLTQLVALYNGHMHVGETVVGIPVTPAPPTPPFQPPTPSLVSTKVKSG